MWAASCSVPNSSCRAWAGKGNVISRFSVNGFFVEPMCAGYCATKAAIIGLTKAMAIDHGKDGMRINCICPGYIDAGLAEGYFQAQPDPRGGPRCSGQAARRGPDWTAR